MRALLSRVPMLVIPHGRDQNDNAVRVTERGAGLSLMADASVEAIRAVCDRLLKEPSFRAAARRLGDLVAIEAENSSVAMELEAAASDASGSAAGSTGRAIRERRESVRV
jgi:UDP:flavonoid glycosyltransferase YjiC (YdhE family)